MLPRSRLIVCKEYLQIEHETLVAGGGFPASEDQRETKGWSQDWNRWKARDDLVRSA